LFSIFCFLGYWDKAYLAGFCFPAPLHTGGFRRKPHGHRCWARQAQIVGNYWNWRWTQHHLGELRVPQALVFFGLELGLGDHARIGSLYDGSQELARQSSGRMSPMVLMVAPHKRRATQRLAIIKIEAFSNPPTVPSSITSVPCFHIQRLHSLC
jgi:hypothetical protein